MTLSVVASRGPLTHTVYPNGGEASSSSLSPFPYVTVEVGDIIVVHTEMYIIGDNTYRYTAVSDTASNTYTTHLVDTGGWHYNAFHVAKCLTAGNVFVRTWHVSNIDGDHMYGQGVLSVIRGAHDTDYIGNTSAQADTVNDWSPTFAPASSDSLLLVSAHSAAVGAMASTTLTTDITYPNGNPYGNGIWGHQHAASTNPQTVNLNSAGSSVADVNARIIEIKAPAPLAGPSFAGIIPI